MVHDPDGLVRDVDVPALDLGRLGGVIGPTRLTQLRARADELRHAMAGRTFWNINSTSSGGGVAEMLWILVGYARGAGLRVTWSGIGGDPRFFEITKRIHHRIHAMPGDGGPLGPAEARHYHAVLDRNGDELLRRIQAGDVVLLHDPQTAGLVPRLRRAGVSVVWRCHIGSESQNEWTSTAWDLLRPDLSAADCLIFSRRPYVPAWAAERSIVVPPSIDPLSPKNQPLDDRTVRAVLARIGLLDGPVRTPTSFVRHDGTVGSVSRAARFVSEAVPIPAGTPLIVQVSRWDPLKDMAGVMQAFAPVAAGFDGDLVLAGPSVSGVSDDPEGAGVFARCAEAWRSLPPDIRRRVHLVSLPMDDLEENAAMVNALQRHATVVVQKSLAEGFGLTVTEAMWKGKPVLASRVGGIPDQLDASCGVLLDDPQDLATAGAELRRLVRDDELRARLGSAAKQRVTAEFVGDAHLMHYADLLLDLLGR